MTRNGNCPHLDILELSLSELYTVKQGYPCAQCDVKGRNLWICLYRRCMHIGCSEHDQDHGTKHFRANQTHCLQLNLSTRRIWCYVCNTEVFLHTKASALMMPDGEASRRDSASSNGSVHQQQYQFQYRHQPESGNDSDSGDEANERRRTAHGAGGDADSDECGLIGLKNIANTCYMNAALQALSNAPPLHGYFMDCGDIVEASTELQMQRAAHQQYQPHNQQKRMVGLARSYHRLVKDMWSRGRRGPAGVAGAGPAGGGFIVPSGILNGIRTVQAMFRGYHQHDTQEFLRCFMEQLHQELQEETPSPPDYAYPQHVVLQPSASASSSSQIPAAFFDDQRSSQCSSPTQSLSEAEYETCDSGVSEQSSLSEENLDHHNQQLQQQQQQQHHKPRASLPPASPTLSFRRYATPRASSPSATSASSYHTTDTTNNNNENATYQRQKLGKDGDNASATGSLNDNSDSPANDNVDPAATSANPTPHKRSIISDVFDGKLLSSVQCLTCDRVSTREENFQDLSLPIPGKDHLSVLHHQSGGGPSHPFGSTSSLASTGSSLFAADAAYHLAAQAGWFWWIWQWFRSFFWGPAVSLYDCMAAFFSADELKGDNMYSCDRCKKLRNGIKYSRVLQLPEMLCIHLKRFRHDLSYSSKIAVPVNFPLYDLDMAAYVHSDCRSRISTFDLTAVICHHGTVGGGHYTCMARHPRNGRWYEYDDQMVTQVSEETVAGCEAYVLFYRKNNAHMLDVRQQALSLLVDVCAPPDERTDSDATGSGVGVGGSDLRFYVSKQWLNKFNTFAEPGPIDNWALLCAHGALPPGRAAMKAQLLVALPQPLWDFLYRRYGGGPVINHLYECDECGRAAAALQRRQHAELAAFQRYKEETTATLYAISMRWLREWQDFVAGAAGEQQRPPGPIANAAIAGQQQRDEDGRPLVLRTVRTGSDYAQVNSMLWRYFHGVYGGGPVIVMRGQPEEDEMVPVGELESDTTDEEDEEIVCDVPADEEELQAIDRPHGADVEVNVDEVTRVMELVCERAQTFCNEAIDDDDEDEDEVILEISTPDADDSAAQPELTMRTRGKTTKNVSFEDDGDKAGQTSDNDQSGDAGDSAALMATNGPVTITVADVTYQQQQHYHRTNGAGKYAEQRSEIIVNKRDRRHRGGIGASNGMFGAEGTYSSTSQPGDDATHIPNSTTAGAGTQQHYSISRAFSTNGKQLDETVSTPQQQPNGYRSANGGGSGEPEATIDHAAAAAIAEAAASCASTDSNTNQTNRVPMTTNLRKMQHKMRKKLKTSKSRINHINKPHHYQSTSANGQ